MPFLKGNSELTIKKGSQDVVIMKADVQVYPSSQLPITVTDLVVTQINQNVVLDWTTEIDVSYKIYRSNDGGSSYSLIGNTGLSSNTFEDINRGIDSETEYYYYIVGNNGTDGDPSNVDSIITHYVLDVQVDWNYLVAEAGINLIRFIKDTGDSTFILPDNTIFSGNTLLNDYPVFDGTTKTLKVIIPEKEVYNITLSEDISQGSIVSLDMSELSINTTLGNSTFFGLVMGRFDSSSIVFPNIDNLSRLRIVNYGLNMVSPVALVIPSNGVGEITSLEIAGNGFDGAEIDLTNINFSTSLNIESGSLVVKLPTSNNNDFSNIRLIATTFPNTLNIGGGWNGNITGSWDMAYNTFTNLQFSNTTNFTPETLFTYHLSTINNPLSPTISTGGLINRFQVGSLATINGVIDATGVQFQTIFRHIANNDAIFSVNTNTFSSFTIDCRNGISGLSNRTAPQWYDLDYSMFTGSFTGGYLEVVSGAVSGDVNPIIYPTNLTDLDSVYVTDMTTSNQISNTVIGKIGTQIIARSLDLRFRNNYTQSDITDVIDGITNNIASFPVGPKVLVIGLSNVSSVLNQFDTPTLTKANNLVTNEGYTITYWDGTSSVTLI